MQKPNLKNVVKVKHFAAKTIQIGASVPWESFLMELLVAFMLAAFAYQGWLAKLALLLFPCAIGSVICFFIALKTLYETIAEHREAKQSAKK